MIPQTTRQSIQQGNIDPQLVGQARDGHKESLDRLVEMIQPQLSAYLFRSTLQQDLADDITQETILEIYRSIGKLSRLNLFWPWVRGIAFNTLRQYYKSERRQRDILTPEVTYSYMKQKQHNVEPDVVGKLMSEEMKEIIFTAMKKLKPDHRQILILRCFEAMNYAQISRLMGGTDFGARVLFFRAKRALQKKMARNGLNTFSLIATLTAFAKLTAPSKAAAAQVAITGQTLHVGGGAAVAGFLGTKVPLITVLVLGIIGVGSLTISSLNDNVLNSDVSASSRQALKQVSRLNNDSYKRWCYFPDGPAGPVMIHSSSLNSGSLQWLQNDYANYLFHQETVSMNNFRTWNSDFSVRRLPTDSAELTNFLNQIEDRSCYIPPINAMGDDLLIISKYSADDNAMTSESTYLNSAVNENYFKYGNPSGNKLVDNRDLMHRRGWTWFLIKGQINGTEIKGKGRMPFVYMAAKNYSPWLQIDLPNEQRVIETNNTSVRVDDDGSILTAFSPGTFFKGFSRPWSGLHTLDIVRRDAARQSLWFETHVENDVARAQVSVKFNHHNNSGDITYDIDMEKDIVHKIILNSASYVGEIEIEYLQELPTDPLVMPDIPRDQSLEFKERSNPGLLWVVELAEFLTH